VSKANEERSERAVDRRETATARTATDGSRESRGIGTAESFPGSLTHDVDGSNYMFENA